LIFMPKVTKISPQKIVKEVFNSIEKVFSQILSINIVLIISVYGQD